MLRSPMRSQRVPSSAAAAGYRNLLSPRALMPLLAYLRSVGAAPEPVSAVATNLPRDCFRTIAASCSMSGSWSSAPSRAMCSWPRFLDHCAPRGVTDLAG